MRGLYLCFGFCLFLVSFLEETNATQSQSNDGVYIVYMGGSVLPNSERRSDHTLLLSSVMNRKKNSVVQTYSNGFLGFAARLSGDEAKSIAQRPGVVSVFPDPVLKLHTTRSWDFLKSESALEIDATPFPPSDSSSTGTDTIIGILDTGIWPESKSFIDTDMGPIPPQWKGKCMAGKDFNSSTCNRKVIGARYYSSGSEATPRDDNGHGTHVSSTAAGQRVAGASYYGLANGTAVGGSPGSRIAMYRVCAPDCLGSSILKGFDDAIADGVNVLSISLGPEPAPPAFDTDPIAIGAFHAVEKGITVVCSGGNDGPFPASVTNAAPWIFTIGATTMDRDLVANVILGGNKVIKGGGITFPKLSKSAIHPLTDGLSALNTSSTYGQEDARDCYPGSLDDAKVKGKIVVCQNNKGTVPPQLTYSFLKDQGSLGMILVNDNLRQVPFDYRDHPISVVTEEDGAEIVSYINSTSKPVATILPTVVIPNYKPAPTVAFFSSRGPIMGIENLLKPDISAPGVAVLAAWPPNDRDETLPGMEAPIYAIESGTSMSCPHVSALVANIKSQHPTWSPSAIRSAIMTTAIQTNNLHGPITTFTGSKATPYDIGAGQINLSGSLRPGLVYENEIIDYIQFLCDIGYNKTKIKSIASSLPSNFSCPSDASSDLISNMNYPSIVVSMLKAGESKTVNRMVTNVGEEDSAYEAIVEAPAIVDVKVVPSKLQFSKNGEKLSFQVNFKLIGSLKENLFGSITWWNEKYKVRSPFVVTIGENV